MKDRYKVFPLPPVPGLDQEFELRLGSQRVESGIGIAAFDYLSAESLRRNTRSKTHREAYDKTLK